MKVLYAAYKHDPRDPGSGSGAHYQFYRAIVQSGAEVRVVGPIQRPALWPERLLKRIYRRHPSRRYVKYNLTNTWRASQAVNAAVEAWRPDVIFTMAPPPLVFFEGGVPCVLRTDTTFLGMDAQGRAYLQHGPVALRLMAWQERRAFRHCVRIITQSTWSRDVLVRDYGVPEDRITVFANPAALPPEVVPETLDATYFQAVDPPLRLLLVGRDYERKGIDIAIEVTRQLNASGLSTTLTVAGLDGNDTEYVHFAGFFDKRDPEQLKQYVDLYRTAHLLIHPARFDASPIVTSEAAAFATPTITNAAGGLATSVADGVSGIVLPRGCRAEVYTEAIRSLIDEPDRYVRLCQATRQRYERKLNWNVASERLEKVLRGILSQST